MKFPSSDLSMLSGDVILHQNTHPVMSLPLSFSAVATNDESALESWYLAGVDFNQGDYDGRTALHLVSALPVSVSILVLSSNCFLGL